ncbi:hypothetical protein Btru_016996 [Bulinus truncatus]|nr:hypothetical protein Btru_016996 [Bulinus truncatus]
MVFFNCNACAEALKKNQVEKHIQRCRQCKVLSCVDCGKDFWGNDYQNHTKCLTENEKYCGKGYVPKVNKGEVKQEQWIEKVQLAIETSASNVKLKDILEKLKEYPNIPRKKQKFENFLHNSLRVSNYALINQVWDVLMSAATNGEKAKTDSTQSANSKNEVSQNGNVEHATTHPDTPTETENGKLSKRERKEERKKLAHKKEKKDKNKNDEVPEEKTKKRKHSEDEENLTKENKSKKKKLESDPLQEEVEGETDDVDTESVTEVKDKKTKSKKKRFDWEAAIIGVLQKKGEVSLKRLRKKVLNEFLSQDAANYSEENMNAKFDKKVTRISQSFFNSYIYSH